MQKGNINLKEFHGFWKEDEDPVLNNISVTMEKGGFYGITGKVGSGKSSLIYAMLYQMPYFKGHIDRNGSCAYVEQEPIIFSETLR